MAQIELEGRKCTNGMGVKRHKLNEGGGEIAQVESGVRAHLERDGNCDKWNYRE